MSEGNIVPFKAKYQKIKEYTNNPAFLAEVAASLPSHITKEKMISVFLTSLTANPKLVECDPFSLLMAVKEASQLGLVTDGVLGHGYILPYGSKAKFIPGFRGLIELARRSGHVEWIQAHVVYEGDEFDYEYGAEPKLKHKPAHRDGEENKLKVVAVYAVAKMTGGAPVFEVLYNDDIEKIRQSSRSGKSGPWVSHWEEMAKKTAVRRLMKYLPLSSDAQAAVAADEYAEAGVLGKLFEQDNTVEDFVDAEGVTTLSDLVEEPETEPDFAPDGKGRISSEEDERFQAAVQALLARGEKISTKETTTALYNKTLGSHGVENLSEIRSRAERTAFYNDMLLEIEAWEALEE